MFGDNLRAKLPKANFYTSVTEPGGPFAHLMLTPDSTGKTIDLAKIIAEYERLEDGEMQSMRDFKIPEEKKEDMVNHPSHYNPEGGRETLDYMEYLAGTRGLIIHCTLNAVKYRERAYKKNSPRENYEKAEFYMNKATDLKAKVNAGAEVVGIMENLI